MLSICAARLRVCGCLSFVAVTMLSPVGLLPLWIPLHQNKPFSVGFVGERIDTFFLRDAELTNSGV